MSRRLHIEIRFLAAVLFALLAISGCGDDPASSGGGHAPQTNEWSVVSRSLFCNDVWASDDGQIFAVGSLGAIEQYDGSSWSQTYVGTNERLTAVWGFSANEVYAVSREGSVHFHDGTAWSRQELGVDTDAAFYDVWGSSGDDIYAVGSYGAIFRFDGQDWHEIETGETPLIGGYLRSVSGSGPSDVYVAGMRALCHFNGESWTTLEDSLFQRYSIQEVHCAALDEIYVLTSRGIVTQLRGDWEFLPGSPDICLAVSAVSRNHLYVLSRNGTELWLHEYSNGLWRVCGQVTSEYSDRWSLFCDGNDDVYIGLRESVWRFDGRSFDQLLHRPGNGIMSITATNDGRAFAIGPGVTMYCDGEPNNWRSLTGPTDLWEAHMLPDGVLVAVGSGSSLWTYDDDNWELEYSQSDARLNFSGIWGQSADDFFVVGGSGGIYHFDGRHLEKHETGIGAHIYDLWGSSNQDIFAVAAYGHILHYDGHNWTSMDNPANVYLFDVFGFAPDNVYAVGQYGVMLHYDGSSWTQIDSGTDEFLSSIWGNDANDIFAVGYGVIVHFDGSSWEAVDCPTTHNLYTIDGSTANNIFAAGSYGRILHYGPR